MINKPNFILSFDCEGKWGNPQKANTTYSKFTNDLLINAYQKIVSLLNKYDIPASFAFVSTLIINPKDTLNILKEDGRPLEETMKFGSTSWVANAIQDISTRNFHGWHCPELIEIVRDLKEGHICLHGGCHIPYSEKLVAAESIDKDIFLMKAAFSQFPDIDKKTFIYPRNIIGFQNSLKNIGIQGYRNIDMEEKKKGIKGKMTRYLNEFITLDKFNNEKEHNDSVLIPLSSSKFINAHIAERKFIPRITTINRIKKMLNQSIRDKQTVHFYSHPHNFISDPDLYQTLDGILKIVSQYRDNSSINIITMKEELETHGN